MIELSKVGPDAPRIVIAGGHSAGHIEPMMNFADALRALEPTSEITALGTVRGLDTTLIPARGYPLELIPPVPLPREFGRALIQTPGKLRQSVRAVGEILGRLDAEILVGFGGYVAAPAYLAARRRGLPIVVHEANARPGVANRLAARLTSHVFTSTPRVRLAHATAIGIPLRPAITALYRPALRAGARERFGLRPDGPVLLITGGSQGAQSMNAAVFAAAPAIRRAGIQVLHIVGPRNRVDAPVGSPADPPWVVVPYVDEMRDAYAAADFVVCRSGALTCAELGAVGLPAAFVPLALRGGEQRLNAVPIVAAGGAIQVDNARFDPAWIENELIPVVTDPVRVAAMSERAATATPADAAAVLARYVLSTIVADRRRASASPTAQLATS